MKAEEHPLSQKPLIERITPGPWTIESEFGLEPDGKDDTVIEHSGCQLVNNAKVLKIQELEETIERLKLDCMIESKMLVDENKILEETISVQKMKLEAAETMIKYGISEYEILKSSREAILKGLREIASVNEDSYTNDSFTMRGMANTILNEHSK